MTTRFIALACATLIIPSAVYADLSSDLLAYYDFEDAGSAGLANKAPGATTDYDAVRGGTNVLYTDWATGTDVTGPGVTGKVDFTSANPAGAGVSDRSEVLIGGVLNLDDDRDEYVSIPIGTAELGAAFTISAWHCLTPGAANTSNRYHVFEPSNDANISWGTQNTSFSSVQSQYRYLGFVSGGPSGGFGPSDVATGQWQHVVQTVTFDGSQATMSIFLNGEFFESRTVAATPATFGFPAIVFGRARLSTTDRDWDGMIDEVGIWTRKLNDNEVKELFARGQDLIPVTTDLVSLGKAFVGVAPADRDLGQASGSGIYNLGAMPLIVASPNAGYVFSAWSGGFSAEPATFNPTVAGSVSSLAGFIPDLADPDDDGLNTFEEVTVYLTEPNNPDTDGDLISDGDEINVTLTNPSTQSQLAAVNYILANLCTGGTEPGDEVLMRDSGTNTVTVHISAKDSTTLASWPDILPGDAGVSMGVAGDDLQLMVPGTADAARFFRFIGGVPAP